MDPDKKAEFINRVLQKAEERQGKITLYHALNKSFELREVFRLSEDTALYVNSFFHDKIIPWYRQRVGIPKKVTNKELQFQILLAHLVFAYGSRPLKVSLSPNTYTICRYLTKFTIDLIKFLEECLRPQKDTCAEP